MRLPDRIVHMMPTPEALRVVLKFGGSSVSSARGWHVISGLIQSRLEGGDKVLVVHSALSGITDGLDLLPDEAVASRHAPLLAGLRKRHEHLIRELDLEAVPELAMEFDELQAVAEGVALTEEVTPRVRARILAFGERLSTRIGVAYLESQGVPVE